VANLVCIKPKVGFNKKGMFFCNWKIIWNNLISILFLLEFNEIIIGKSKMKRRNGNRNLLKYKRNQKSSITFFVDVASTPIKSAPITSTPVKTK
jgi:hypothetical protein